jgi:hypothetical protein
LNSGFTPPRFGRPCAFLRFAKGNENDKNQGRGSKNQKSKRSTKYQLPFIGAGYRNGIDPSDSGTNGAMTGRNALGSN